MEGHQGVARREGEGVGSGMWKIDGRRCSEEEFAEKASVPIEAKTPQGSPGKK